MIQQAGLEYPASANTRSSRRLGLLALAVAAGTFVLIRLIFTAQLAAGAAGLIESAFLKPVVVYAVAPIFYIVSMILARRAMRQEASKVAPGLALGVALVGLVYSLFFGLQLFMYS